VDTEGTAEEVVLRDLRTYKIGRQVEVADTPDHSVLSVVGPRADEVVESALGSLPAGDEHSVSELPDGVFGVRTNLGIDFVTGRPAELAARLLEASAQPVSFDAAEII